MNLTTHVFVDFENVSDIDLGLIEGKPMHVTLMIGKNQKKLELSLVQQIHRLSAQVELIEVGATGRNALDMTLAYYLGKAVQKFPAHQFHIVSGDKDYDALLSHLRTQEHKVSRCSEFTSVPGLPKPKKPAAKPVVSPPVKPKPTATTTAALSSKVDRVAIVFERFISPANTNKPSKKSALSAHLKTSIGKTGTDAMVEELIRKLIDKKILQIDDQGKVLYSAA